MRSNRAIRSILLLALFAFIALPFGSSAWCQGEPEGPIHPRTGVQPQAMPKAEQERRALRSQVNEVIAPITVRNASGEMVLDLTQKNFHVFDNGAEQKIDHFDLGGEPFSIVLAVETSSRIDALMPQVRKTGIIFTQTVMGQTSEAAVIGYDDSVLLLHGITTDSDAIQSVINHLREGADGSRVYDAMAKGISILEKRPAARRRILVVMGEARDTGSENKLGEVLRRAELANVTIYSIGLSTTMAALRAKPSQAQPPEIGPPGTYPTPLPPGTLQTPDNESQVYGNMDLMGLAVWLLKTGKNAVGPNSLAVASKATGGLHVNTMKDRSIEKAMDEIGGELHAQYSISYRPKGDNPSGYHEIKITVDRPNVTVRTRPGYYIAPPRS
ncbi:MAG: VWA domain-containing protein [Candidatus Acidiferrales bacterium]